MADFDVLVVDPLDRQRGKIAFLLRAAGYRVEVASTFEAAREKIAHFQFACVLTSVKLGLYNGLHLIARARRVYSAIASVLTYDVADPVLQSEARTHDTQFVVLPCPGAALLDAVERSIQTASKSPDLSFSQMKVCAGSDFVILP